MASEDAVEGLCGQKKGVEKTVLREFYCKNTCNGADLSNAVTGSKGMKLQRCAVQSSKNDGKLIRSHKELIKFLRRRNNKIAQQQHLLPRRTFGCTSLDDGRRRFQPCHSTRKLLQINVIGTNGLMLIRSRQKVAHCTDQKTFNGGENEKTGIASDRFNHDEKHVQRRAKRSPSHLLRLLDSVCGLHFPFYYIFISYGSHRWLAVIFLQWLLWTKASSV